MPINLNSVDLDELAQKIEGLGPGRALMSTDGQIVRREANNVGFACGVGATGYAIRKARTAVEAAEDMLRASAQHMHPQALGGGVAYDDYEKAWESVRRGESGETAGPSPATKVVRAVSSRATLPSYKVRADRARSALRDGDIGGAIRQLEAVKEHASNNGRLEDVMRAERALQSIRENHEVDPDKPFVPKLQHTSIELRTIGNNHHVFRNGRDVTGPLPRSAAEARRNYLVREAAKQEDLQAIENEIAGVANLVRRADENPEGAAA